MLLSLRNCLISMNTTMIVDGEDTTSRVQEIS